ncbi:MAG: ribonuclease HI [Planctomycetota bacterium]|jgi:ribonuclease HI
MDHVDIYTDGSCLGNPGPGGWCAILRSGSEEKVLCGGDPQTTNNRMELAAPLEALKSLKKSCRVRITSDSKYLVSGMNEWVHRWVRRGWRRARNKKVENVDLWKSLVEIAGKHHVEWVWTRGHAGHAENERCDRLAKAEIDKLT